MAKIIIEILRSGGGRKDYKIFDADAITIGRGYQNDLILSDPYVSAQHVILRTDADPWTLEDLASENGVLINDRKFYGTKIDVKSGDEIIIGKTQLRIISSAHPVEPALRMTRSISFMGKMGSPFLTILIIIALLMVCLLQAYLGAFEKLSVGKLMIWPLLCFILILIWAGIWAFVGRLIKHKTQFLYQLCLGCLIYILMAFLVPISDYLGYAANSFVMAAVTYDIILGGLIALQLMGNLSIATSIAFQKRIIAALIVPISMIALFTFGYIELRKEFSPRPYYFDVLKPNFFRIAPVKSIDGFLKDSEKIFDIKN